MRVRDISPRGIGLFSSRQIGICQRLVVQLYTYHKEEPVWLVCQVAYCRKVESGSFSVGARISEILRADQIRKMEAHTCSREELLASKSTSLQTADIERISKAILG